MPAVSQCGPFGLSVDLLEGSFICAQGQITEDKELNCPQIDEVDGGVKFRLMMRGEVDIKKQSLNDCYDGCKQYLKSLRRYLNAELMKETNKQASDKNPKYAKELGRMIEHFDEDCAPILQINFHS